MTDKSLDKFVEDVKATAGVIRKKREIQNSRLAERAYLESNPDPMVTCDRALSFAMRKEEDEERS